MSEREIERERARWKARASTKGLRRVRTPKEIYRVGPTKNKQLAAEKRGVGMHANMRMQLGW